jgi:Ferritin-like
MNPSTPIETKESLEYYLDVAMQLEHATIPPYLTAAYTARIGANSAAIDAITAVAREEMLHLTLAGNLLNAIHGSPNLMCDGFVPPFPCHLPDGETDFEVGIVKFSADAIKTFLNIERPSHPGKAAVVREHGGIQYIAKHDLRKETRGLGRGILPSVPTKDHEANDLELHFWSIGEFYNAIRNGLKHLTDKLGEKELFCGEKDKQINPKYYFSAGGDLTRITNLETALAAIELISAQGEGYTDETHGMGDELAHYYRFEQISLGKYYLKGDTPHNPRGKDFPKDYLAVFPIKSNAKIADYADFPAIKAQAMLFNGRYKRFLEKLTRAFNGEPDLFAQSYKDMYQIKQEMEYLIRNPLGDSGENAAPTFEMNVFTYPPED